MEISKINDFELAKNYLISSNWDETQAINKYFSRIDKKNITSEKDFNLNTIIYYLYIFITMK